MTGGNLTTVANVPQKVPIVGKYPNGVRLLGRAANASDTFVFFVSQVNGTHDGIASTEYNLLPIGAPATSIPYTIPGEHFTNGEAWIISTASGMIIDWSAG